MQENFPAKTRRGLHNEGEIVAGVKDPILLMTLSCSGTYTITALYLLVVLLSRTKGLSGSLLISGVLHTLLSKLRSF